MMINQTQNNQFNTEYNTFATNMEQNNEIKEAKSTKISQQAKQLAALRAQNALLE